MKYQEENYIVKKYALWGMENSVMVSPDDEDERSMELHISHL